MWLRHYRCGLIVLATAALSGSAAAQTNSGTAGNDEPRPAPQATLTASGTVVKNLFDPLVLRGQVLRGVRDPMLRGGVGAPKPEIVLVVQNDGKTAARARIGYIHGNFTADATFTGPVSGGTFATPSGLAAGISGRGRVQYVRWGGTAETTRSSAVRFASSNALGLEAIANRIAADIEGDVRAETRTFRAGSPPTTATLDQLDTRAVLRNVQAAVDPLLRDGTLTTSGTPFFVSFSYELGSKSYRYVDPATLDDASLKRSSHTFEGSFGWLLATGVRTADSPGVYVGANIDSFRRFKVASERQICRPLTPGGFECDKFIYGAPVEQNGASVALESRLWLLGANLGLNPTIGYDGKDKAWTVEVPMHFLKLVADVDKPIFSGVPDLAGGVSVGWKSGAEGGPYVLFFVGPTFKLPDPKVR
jgi:hypothetical protein